MLESNSKLYYSIKEVSKMTELKPYVLRYWESEFPSLKPAKNKAGNRTYKKQDIQVILDIKKLLYNKKFTIKGAVEELKNRSITRPRQLAMALTKELTRHSLPEIGEAFNGRDHTTVLHACKKIAELRKESPSHEEDYRNLTRALTN